MGYFFKKIKTESALVFCLEHKKRNQWANVISARLVPEEWLMKFVHFLDLKMWTLLIGIHVFVFRCHGHPVLMMEKLHLIGPAFWLRWQQQQQKNNRNYKQQVKISRKWYNGSFMHIQLYHILKWY